MSSADNGNHWAKIAVVGSVDITDGGINNRNGVGANVTFRSLGGKAVTRPVLAGSSYASQDSRELIFGMGDKHLGRVDVVWPGGVKNRLYAIKPGERLTLPEIPCSYDTAEPFRAYSKCVNEALRNLKRAGIISGAAKIRLKISAFYAYFAER